MTQNQPNLRLAALTRFAIAITILNVAGHLWLGFEQSLAHPLVGLATAYSVELVLETIDAWTSGRPPRYRGGVASLVRFLLPAHITGLATAMLLYSNSRLLPIAFAAAAGIASKYVLRVRIAGQPRHCFNPSNFGITATLLAFPWIGIAMPYMFTESLVSWGNWVLPLIMIASGMTLNALFTKRLPLIASWLTAFVLQAALRSAFTGTIFIASLVPMTGVAFILFTFYMVTDPSTTPSTLRGQILFGAAVAAAYGLLMLSHVVFGMFFALSLVCGARGALLWVAHALEARRTVPVGRLKTATFADVAQSK